MDGALPIDLNNKQGTAWVLLIIHSRARELSSHHLAVVYYFWDIRKFTQSVQANHAPLKRRLPYRYLIDKTCLTCNSPPCNRYCLRGRNNSIPNREAASNANTADNCHARLGRPSVNKICNGRVCMLYASEFRTSRTLAHTCLWWARRNRHSCAPMARLTTNLCESNPSTFFYARKISAPSNSCYLLAEPLKLVALSIRWHCSRPMNAIVQPAKQKEKHKMSLNHSHEFQSINIKFLAKWSVRHNHWQYQFVVAFARAPACHTRTHRNEHRRRALSNKSAVY